MECAKALTVDKDGDGTIDQYGYGLVGNLTGNTWFRFVPELWSAGGEVANRRYDGGHPDNARRPSRP